MTAPRRIQLRRVKGWRLHDISPDAIVVARPSKWGNPFAYRCDSRGLVRYRPNAPESVDYEGRISKNGMRHDYWDPDGTVTEYWVRYATRDEIVALFRRTLLNPTAGMISAWPSRNGRFARFTVDEARHELAGHDLACWCRLEDEHGHRVPCHADVLLEIANQVGAS